MNDVNIRIFPNLDRLSQAAAILFNQAATAAVAARGRFLVALAGGGTPEPLFRLLALSPFAEQVPWAHVHLFWGDERCVPVTDPGSSFGQVRQLLLPGVPLPMSNIHRIKGELTPADAAAEYAADLAALAEPGRAWPVFDLVLLGLGRDGHTASLFPGPPAPAVLTDPVVAVTAQYEDRPAQRVSLTPLVFNDARQILFLVSGAGKAPAVQAVLEGDPEPARWPAQLIRPPAGQVHWYLDTAAAAALRTAASGNP